MGILRKLQDKTGEVRAREKIRPLIESRMMRDILLEIGQRGSEGLDPQSVPLEQRTRAARIASECGLAGMRQSVVDEVRLNAAGITLVCDGEETTFLFGDYNYEDIQDTDCLPAVAQYLVQHMRGYYNITRTFSSVSKPNGRGVDKKTHEVTISRHHEDTPLRTGPGAETAPVLTGRAYKGPQVTVGRRCMDTLFEPARRRNRDCSDRPGVQRPAGHR